MKASLRKKEKKKKLRKENSKIREKNLEKREKKELLKNKSRTLINKKTDKKEKGGLSEKEKKEQELLAKLKSMPKRAVFERAVYIIPYTAKDLIDKI